MDIDAIIFIYVMNLTIRIYVLIANRYLDENKFAKKDLRK